MTVGNSAIEGAMSNGSGHSAGEAVVETNRLAKMQTGPPRLKVRITYLLSRPLFLGQIRSSKLARDIAANEDARNNL